ncbi:hypothetical protein PsAD5_02501 [Pseudovibrio sp. Ad5]|uniref:hypothetical protein n=1 Tax=Pseudovibrio sp. Ad5 TaxID=989436 RepID=UPI0007AEE182|nr:hypothetical protein [Pseudovibrio sp. Ad5]KZK96314.1 hypothetical protein PsAD5_02501 [Pseudovibrio sp. Ad5]
MNSIEKVVSSNLCREILLHVNEAAKLSVLVVFAIVLLLLAPALDETVIEAKQSISSEFISTQLSSFDVLNER